MSRGDIWWADLGEPKGSVPALRRPVVIVSANSFNRSRIRTVTVAIVTSNLALARAPGNVLVRKRGTGLRSDSVVNVSSLLTLDKDSLDDVCGQLNAEQIRHVDNGLRLALGLS
jgi:mRNA interferase MazF